MKLLATLLLLTLQAVAARAEEAPNLRIAVVVPFSSAIQAFAQDALNGAALGANAGIDRLKRDPPIHVFSVKLDFFDDRGSREAAETVARTIVGSGKYGAVVGGVNSGTAIPAAPIYEAAGLINISLGATHPQLTQWGHRWVFRMAMDDAQLARKTYSALVPRFPATPALFVYDDTAYGKFTVDGFASAHPPFQGQNTDLLNLGLTGEGDMANVKRILGPKAVLYLGGMDLFATQVIDRLPQRIQWTLVTGDGACTEPMAQAGARLDIALVCASQERKASVPPSNSDFEKAYTAQFGLPPGPFALAAFDAVALLVESFGRLGTSDPALVREHLKSGGPFPGGEGPVAFDSQGNNTLAPAYIYQAEKGNLVFKETLR